MPLDMIICNMLTLLYTKNIFKFCNVIYIQAYLITLRFIIIYMCYDDIFLFQRLFV